MAQRKPLLDEYGIIYEALVKIPDNRLKMEFLEALAELEDNNCHRTRTFPKTRLHRVRGVKQHIYRADINKTSGWRIHLQYVDGQIVLKDVIEGKRHDDVIKVINSKKGRYESLENCKSEPCSRPKKSGLLHEFRPWCRIPLFRDV